MTGWGLGLRVQGLGASGLGFRVQGLLAQTGLYRGFMGIA